MSLVPNPLFHTPADTLELDNWLDRLPAADGVRLTAITAAIMAWNLAAKLAAEDAGQEVAP